MTTQIGIEDYGFATGSKVFDLSLLAEHQQISQEKYTIGIGQEKFSVPSYDEDVVTLAAAAASQITSRMDPAQLDSIRTLIVATESGIDQSKAVAVYVHRLLELHRNVRCFEVKQACYGGTAGLATAQGIIARNNDERVLVVAVDVARYDADSSGEPTQGNAAVALLVSATPTLLAFDHAQGLAVTDAMDFWRPNHRTTALVDGRASIQVYIQQVLTAWDDYARHGGRQFEDFAAFCYHQPFTKMAAKAHQRLSRHVSTELSAPAVTAQIDPTFVYNRVVGNSYTASMYVGLIGLLEGSNDLSNKPIAFASYGSGAMCEVFSAVVLPSYADHLHTERTQHTLGQREPVDFQSYRRLYYDYPNPTDGTAITIARETPGPFRLAEISDNQRHYEAC